MNIYEECPRFEDNNLLLRFIEKEDIEDLFEVYSDKNALPFFNSDNCDGDNFYYSTKEKMQEALTFWKQAYDNKWFVRWSIVDKSVSKVIGTIELCHRVSDDAFNNTGILRIDVKSDYEKEDILFNICSLIIPPAFELFDCSAIITKAPVYAVERISAIQKLGFKNSENLLIGKDGYAYNGYWIVNPK